MMTRILTCIAVLILTITTAGCVQPLEWPTTETEIEAADTATEATLPIASPSEAGVDPQLLAALVDGLQGGRFGFVHSVLAAKDGNLVLEAYADGYDRETKHYVASVTKSITSLLIGIAMDKGLLDAPADGGLDLSVLELVPDREAAILADPAKADLRLKHILSMSGGLEWDEQTYGYDDPRNDCDQAEHSDDSVRFVLQKPVEVTPGTEFEYNCGLSILLSSLIQERSGMDTAEFARQVLFAPLGIQDFTWERFQDGLVDTPGGLHLRPMDMLKIGQLALNRGEWDGKRIVSAAWVDESTQTQMTTGLGPDYGYHWWRGTLFVDGQDVESYFASGHGGQKIFVFPALDLVVAITQQVFDNPMAEPMNMIMLTRIILPAVMSPEERPQPIMLDSQDLARLAGEYVSADDGTVLTILHDEGKLLLQAQDIGTVELWPETSQRFAGSVMEIVDFQIVFENSSEPAQYLDLHIDFRHGRFYRTP